MPPTLCGTPSRSGVPCPPKPSPCRSLWRSAGRRRRGSPRARTQEYLWFES